MKYFRCVSIVILAILLIIITSIFTRECYFNNKITQNKLIYDIEDNRIVLRIKNADDIYAFSIDAFYENFNIIDIRKGSFFYNTGTITPVKNIYNSKGYSSLVVTNIGEKKGNAGDGVLAIIEYKNSFNKVQVRVNNSSIDNQKKESLKLRGNTIVLKISLLDSKLEFAPFHVIPFR